jgi:O-antigen/teichoic acid export membrane protein
MLGKKLSQSFVFSLLSMGFTFVSSVFIARIGGAAMFGNISLATSFQALLRQMFVSSLNNAHLKAFSENKEVGIKNYLLVNIAFNVLSSIAILLVVLINTASGSGAFTDLQIKLIIIFIVQDYLAIPLFMYSTNQYAQLNITKGNLADFVGQILQSIAKIGAVLYGFQEIGVAWSIIAACALGSVFPIYSLIKERTGKVSKESVRKYVRYSFYIATSALAYGLLLSFDKILLGFFSVSAEDIGYYNAGNRLGVLLMSLGVSVGGIFLSVFTKNRFEKNGEKTLEQLRKYERIITIYFLPVVLVPVFFGKELMNLIYGSAYQSGYPVLVVSIFVAYVKTLTIPYQNLLFASNRFKEFNRTSVIFSISIVSLTMSFAHFNVFGTISLSVAVGLLTASLIERMAFVWEAKKVHPGIKLVFHPKELAFFAVIVAGFFVYMSLMPHDLGSLILRAMIIILIIPIGSLLNIYTRADYSLLKGLA